MKYDPRWREAMPRPALKRRDKETWFDCLKRHCDQYGADHFKVLELYQSLRAVGVDHEKAARDAAWTYGVADDD